MSDDRYEAASAGSFAAEETHRELLQSIADVARLIFDARAASVFLHDDETDQLVFEAVSGEGEQELVGVSVPSSTGIAGWVLITRQPLVIDDLSADPRFAKAVAEGTGYVPRAIVAVPLLVDERAIGVLEVLDRPTDRPFSLADMDLLTRFAHQAAIGLDLLSATRRANRTLLGEGNAAVVGRLAALVERADDDGDALALLEALERVLRSRA